MYRGVLHESIAQAAMFVAVTKSTIDVADADGIGAAIVTAATIARTAPTGPVYVGIPTDLLDAPAPRSTGPSEWARNRNDLQPVLDAIAASERPLLWVGGGARDASEGIDALASRLGAPVITTYQARGVSPADHPLLVGAPPHEPPVIDLIEQADLVIVIGSDLDAMTTMAWRLPLPERRVAINIDPTDAAKNYSMDAVLAAEARVTELVADAIPPREPWAGDLAALVKTLRDELRTAPETAESIEFLEHTEAALPADAVVFADMCIPGYWLAGHYRVRTPRSLHYPMGWGTLGFAFPAAIGGGRAPGPGPAGRVGERRRRDALRDRRARDRGAGAPPAHRGRRRRRRLRDAPLRPRPGRRSRHRAHHPRLRRGRPRVRDRGPHRRRGWARTTRPRSPRP